MKRKPSRRSLMAAVGAAAAASTLRPGSAGASTTGSELTYRTARELLKALADRAHRERPADRRADRRRLLDDRTTIAFAGMVEREFGGFTPPPGL